MPKDMKLTKRSNSNGIIMRNQTLLKTSILLAVAGVGVLNIAFYGMPQLNLLAGVFLLFAVMTSAFWMWSEIVENFSELQRAKSESTVSRMMVEARHLSPETVESIMANPEALPIHILLGSAMGKPSISISIVGVGGLSIPFEFVVAFVEDSSLTNTKPIRDFNAGSSREYARALVELFVQLNWVAPFTGGNESAGWRIPKHQISSVLHEIQLGPIGTSELDMVRTNARGREVEI